MKKPIDYKDLTTCQLTDLIHKLNVWNSKQSISDKAHNDHYKLEIAPLVKLREQKWKDFWSKYDE